MRPDTDTGYLPKVNLAVKFGKQLAALLEEEPWLRSRILSYDILKTLLKKTTGAPGEQAIFEDAVLAQLSAAAGIPQLTCVNELDICSSNAPAHALTDVCCGRRAVGGEASDTTDTVHCCAEKIHAPVYTRAAVTALCVLKIIKKAAKVGLDTRQTRRRAYSCINNAPFFKRITEPIESCPICLESADLRGVRLACNHGLCWACLIRCATKGFAHCPLCREEVLMQHPLAAASGYAITRLKIKPMKLEEDSRTRVLFLGIDGVRPDCLAWAEMPALKALILQSEFSMHSQIKGRCLSGPSWASIFSGQPMGVHGVEDNETVEAGDYSWPVETMFSRLRSMGRSVEAFVSSWSGVSNMLKQETATMAAFLDQGVLEQDGQACSAALKSLATSDICFVYLNAVDQAGHVHGFGPQIPQYLNSLKEVDRLIAPLIAAAQREGMAIAVTTDHGGTSRSSMSEQLVGRFFEQCWCKGQAHDAGVHGTDEDENSLTPHWLTFQCYYTPGSTRAKEILPPPTNMDVARRVIDLATKGSPAANGLKGPAAKGWLGSANIESTCMPCCAPY